MRRFLINPSEINKPTPVIQGQDVLHIRKVLRLKSGDHIILLDGQGNEYEAIIEKLSNDHIDVRIIQRQLPHTEPPIELIVMQSLLKEKKMDLLIRSLTEIGIRKWIPVISEHSIPKPDEKRLSSRMQRWKEIAKESIKQCRRSIPPEILVPIPFYQAIQSEKNADLKLIFWENEISTLKESIDPGIRNPARIVVVLGPEGGFSNKEVDMAKSEGFISVSLGPRILRAETAAMAACTVIQHLYGDFS